MTTDDNDKDWREFNIHDKKKHNGGGDDNNEQAAVDDDEEEDEDCCGAYSGLHLFDQLQDETEEMMEYSFVIPPPPPPVEEGKQPHNDIDQGLSITFPRACRHG